MMLLLLYRALSAFQASENYLRDWGISLLSPAEGAHHQHHQAPAAPPAQPHEDASLRQKGVASLRSVTQQLHLLLPAETRDQQHSHHSTTGHCGAADAGSNNILTPADEIKQSLSCLEHLITGLEAAGGSSGPATAPDQHQSASDLVKHAWPRLVGSKKPQDTAAAVEQSIQQGAHRTGAAAEQAMHSAADGAAHAASSAQDAAAGAADAAASTADKAASAARGAVHQAAHAATTLPGAARYVAVEGTEQVIYTAGFLTQAAKDAAARTIQPVLKAGEAAADAAKHVAHAASHAGPAAQHSVSDAAHKLQDTVTDTATAVQHTGSTAAHVVQDTAQAASDRAGQDLHRAADQAAGAADHAWEGAQHDLHDRLSHVKRILAVVRRLPSMAVHPVSTVASLQGHSRAHGRDSGGADSDSGAGQHGSGDAGLREARAAHIQELHKELESLQVRGRGSCGMSDQCVLRLLRIKAMQSPT